MMQAFRAGQRIRRDQDSSSSNRFHDRSLLGKLHETDDTYVDDVEDEKNVDDEESKQTLLEPRSEQQRQERRGMLTAFIIAGLIIVCLLLLASNIVLWRARSTSPPETAANKVHYHCGNSTTEARALGCEFDILSYSWTPQECFDRATAREFSAWLHSDDRRFGTFPFFFDEEAQQHVPDELALSESHGRTIHTTQEEHLGHCTFMLRRWHRLAQQGGNSHHFNHRFGKYLHTKHCSERILNGLMNPDLLKEEVLNSKFGITFEKC